MFSWNIGILPSAESGTVAFKEFAVCTHTCRLKGDSVSKHTIHACAPGNCCAQLLTHNTDVQGNDWVVLAAVEVFVFKQEQAGWSAPRLMEQPHTGKHAWHALQLVHC